MTGTLLAAKFSWGCPEPNRLGFTPTLEKYAISEGRSHSEKEIRKILKELLPYFYYLVIAKSNKIADPFSTRVVRAHWIGNELTKKVKVSVIEECLNEVEGQHDKMTLAIVAGLLEKTGSAHHNIYGQYTPKCSVTSDGKYFYHLGERRIKAGSQDLKNLAKYGRK